MKLFAALLISLVLTGCVNEPQYAGKTETQWIADAKLDNIDQRQQAAMALGHFKDEKAISTIRGLCKDTDCLVRINAAESLFAIAPTDQDVVLSLRSVINDPLGWSVTDHLKQVLREMGHNALPLSDDLQHALDNAPNSKQKRWQDCIDALRG